MTTIQGSTSVVPGQQPQQQFIILPAGIPHKAKQSSNPSSNTANKNNLVPAQSICYKCQMGFLDVEDLMTHLNTHSISENHTYTCGLCLADVVTLQAIMEHTKAVLCNVCNVVIPCIRHARSHRNSHAKVPIKRNVTMPQILNNANVVPRSLKMVTTNIGNVQLKPVDPVTPVRFIISKPAGAVKPTEPAAKQNIRTTTEPLVIKASTESTALDGVKIKQEPIEEEKQENKLGDAHKQGIATQAKIVENVTVPDIKIKEEPPDPDFMPKSPTSPPLSEESLNILKPHKCDLCGERYQHLNHLSNHIKTHGNEFPYKCGLCGTGFVHEHKYARHLERFHAGESPADRPYKCKTCGAGFKQRNHLNQHNRTHTGEKPYKCKKCGTAFALLGNLNYHMRIHGGQKPFKCDVCKACFRSSTHLKHHFGSVHRDLALLDKVRNDANEKVNDASASVPQTTLFLVPISGAAADPVTTAESTSDDGEITNMVFTNPLEGNPVDGIEDMEAEEDSSEEYKEKQEDDQVLQEILMEGP